MGSTVVPGLAAKDVIDVMTAVGNDADPVKAADALEAAGWSVCPAGRPAGLQRIQQCKQAVRRRMPPIFGSVAVVVLTAPTTMSVSDAGRTTLT